MKKKVFMTGASGGMGQQSLKQMVNDLDLYTITILAFDSEKDREILEPYQKYSEITIHFGNLLDYDLVKKCVQDADIILHIAAFVSPAADYFPKKAMEINYGSAKNILTAITELGQKNKTKLVSIGTIAETGDRMPPIHWGRVGDPIKTSIFDYYAVSKVAAERIIIESEVTHWVSLRQTGIIGPAMSSIVDAIMFHNCLDNVLEYVSDRDSGRLMANLCRYEFTSQLPSEFWNHIYNIGGGESCRASTFEMYQTLYGLLGFTNLDYVVDPKLYAIRNFHGHYYLDSDKLEEYLHFRQDGMDYFYDCYLQNLGLQKVFVRTICKLPGGQKFIGAIMRRKFSKYALTQHGTLRFIKENIEDHIDAYWGSKEKWEQLPNKLSNFQHFTQWEQKQILDHGYDESKPSELLELADMKQAAEFRGGKCLSTSFEIGNWRQKVKFQCAFNHSFEASATLVLEGGHWCPVCESKSWNYGQRAKVDPFFAQVWQPLHDDTEVRVYPKIVSEFDYDSLENSGS